MPDRETDHSPGCGGIRPRPFARPPAGTPARSASIEGCFANPVVAFDVVYGREDPAPRLPAELDALVARAVEARRREFAFGRECARRAVAELGLRLGVIGQGADRAPIWPEGTSGSISHVDGYALAVAAPALADHAVGVDVVELGSINDDIVPLAFTEDERTDLASTVRSSRDLGLAVAFGAKEAFFKAQFQLTKRWVDFDEVEVSGLDTPALGAGFVELVARPGSLLVHEFLWPIGVGWVATEHRVVVGVTASASPPA